MNKPCDLEEAIKAGHETKALQWTCTCWACMEARRRKATAAASRVKALADRLRRAKRERR